MGSVDERFENVYVYDTDLEVPGPETPDTTPEYTTPEEATQEVE